MLSLMFFFPLGGQPFLLAEASFMLPWLYRLVVGICGEGKTEAWEKKTHPPCAQPIQIHFPLFKGALCAGERRGAVTRFIRSKRKKIDTSNNQRISAPTHTLKVILQNNFNFNVHWMITELVSCFLLLHLRVVTKSSTRKSPHIILICT